MSRKLVSVVSPVLNEETAIPIFYERLSRAMEPLRDRYDFELVFTNNCSTDRTLDVIQELRARDDRVQVMTFSRNFGYQPSVLAGITQATGDAIVVIDVDCEDPPEMIPVFIAEWEQGYDVVYGRRDRRSELRGVALLRKVWYRLNRMISDTEFILYMAEFALTTRRVRDLVIANRSTFPFLRTEVAFAGFRRRAIPYKRDRRAAGRSHYNFAGNLRFAIAGIMSSSTFPLRLAAYLFFPLALVNTGLVTADVSGLWAPAFRVMVGVDLTAISGVLGVLSLYLARVYKDGVARPVYVVDWERSLVNRQPDPA
ncbi:MAG: glycosyltransferase family 2 protein [Candidatus Dormibacteria bacterium]